MAKRRTAWICRSCQKGFRFRDSDDTAHRECPRCGAELARKRSRFKPAPKNNSDEANAPTHSDLKANLPPASRRSKRPLKPENAHSNWLSSMARGCLRGTDEGARLRSPVAIGLVLTLTVSLAMDTVAESGFVPLLFGALTYLNFIVHELGHLATKLLPLTISIAAGTAVQLALPAGSIFMFRRQYDHVAACFASTWLSVSLMHTADYIADARAQAGDMSTSASFWTLTSGQTVRPNDLIHDWHYMLSGLGLLNWDQQLANAVRLLAAAIAITAVVFNVRILWTSVRHRFE